MANESQERKKRQKKESIIQTRSDGKRSAHVQARYNEATVSAHSDILDMLHNLFDEKKRSQQDILDEALGLLYTHLTEGGKVGERLQNQSITSEIVTLVRQASEIQAYALSMLDRIEQGTFVVGDISMARGEIADKQEAMNKTSESLGIRILPDAGQFAGEISFSDDED
jgi:hypothetical protein